ncbi:MAG: BatA domain-containing protein, partial [Aureliella sp.]
MQFLFQPLTWGFLLVGVPVLVHLINMLRHRKQSWAAMDFLLESYRKHRRWVLLKQWLLLAARMLAMLLLVAMLARWISGAQSLSWFGGQVTHHYILLDDSYSMGEQIQGETAYSRGLKAVQSLIRSIAAQPGEHQLTLLRWSRAELASRSEEDQARVDVAADLIAQTVPRDASRLLDRIAASEPTALELSPEPAVELIAPLISSAAGEQVELTFVTDLRRNEWGQPESLKSRLAPLVRGTAHVQFIDCADNTDANLSVVSLQPEQETWAAGVPLMVKFQVRNQGQMAARNVVVKVRSLVYPEGAAKPLADVAYSGEALESPPVVIEEIPPGETVLRQVQMVFSLPGQHVVEASLAEDRLPVDNRRWCVIGIRQSQQILIIDSSADPNDAFYLKTALQPDGRQPTGMAVETRDAAFLRDVAPEALSAWDVIVLVEVPRMDPQAIANLEQYVRGGGGLAIFVGPSTNLGVINEQFTRSGQGLFPAPATEILETAVAAGSTEPQVAATDHPILAPLKNLSASPFQLIEIRKMLGIDASEMQGKVESVALGPDRRPL